MVTQKCPEEEFSIPPLTILDIRHSDGALSNVGCQNHLDVCKQYIMQ